LIVYLKVLIAAIRLLKMTGPLAGEFKLLRVYELADDTIFDFPLNSATKPSGQSSLFWDSRRGHALVERVDAGDGMTSSYKLLKLYSRKLPKAGDSVWLSGWLGNRPEHFELEQSVSEVRMLNGTRAWLFDNSSDKWVIHIHGRRAHMGETLRNVSQFASLGYSQLAISMATDPKPHGLGIGKSNLGQTEWKEIEDAVSFAKSSGAKEIILFGWSQGALITGQFLMRSADTSSITGVIFDSPLLDYRSTMRLHATKQGFGEEAGDRVIQAIVSSKSVRALGYKNIDVDSLSLVNNTSAGTIPLLVLFSGNDGYVAIEDVHKLPLVNSEVRLVEIAGARHCRLYNHDRVKYQQAIATWLSDYYI
jgi:alpha-beta hydrolase superfamily lysophospholipase